MPTRHSQQGYSLASRILLALLLASMVSLAGFTGFASLRHPTAASAGTSLHGDVPGTTLETRVLRVGSYNIRRGKGLDGSRDLARIGVNVAKLDLVALTEVGHAFFEENDARQLGEALETGWLFAPAQERWFRDYFGNGLLSRLASRRWQSEPIVFDEEKGTGHRQLLTAEYRWRGEPFALIVIHAERGDVRDDQIRAALAEFEKYPTAILAGDFNAHRDEPIMQSILSNAGIVDATVDIGNQQVDWIFVRGFDVQETGWIPPGASDHPLIWAALSLPGDEL